MITFHRLNRDQMYGQRPVSIMSIIIVSMKRSNTKNDRGVGRYSCIAVHVNVSYIRTL
jgi:hypothetical protein